MRLAAPQPAQQAPQQAALKAAINKQSQTPYAAQNGMAKAKALGTATAPGQVKKLAAPQTAVSSAATQNPLAGKPMVSQLPPGAEGAWGSIAAPKPAQAPSGSTQTGVSPVTANGKINEANQPVASMMPQPAVMPGSTGGKPAQASPLPAGAEGARLAAPPTGGIEPWFGASPQPAPAPQPVPTPVAQPQPAAQPVAQPMPQPLQGTGGLTAAPKPAAPGTSPMVADPYQQGGVGGNTALPQVNSAGKAIAPTAYPARQANTQYTAGNISQYGGGLNAGLEGTVQGALEQAIAGGGGLNVEALKAKAKDDAFAMRDDSLSAARDAAAASGRTGGGFDLSQQGDIRSKAIEGVLGQYRNIDIADAQARNDNLYKGVEMGNTFLNSQANRRQTDYTTGLQGQMSQEDLLQKQAAQNLAGYNADLQGWLGKAGIDMQGNVANIQANADKYRARLGLLGDVLNIMERGRQNDQNAGLGWGQINSNILSRL